MPNPNTAADTPSMPSAAPQGKVNPNPTVKPAADASARNTSADAKAETPEQHEACAPALAPGPRTATLHTLHEAFPSTTPALQNAPVQAFPVYDPDSAYNVWPLALPSRSRSSTKDSKIQPALALTLGNAAFPVFFWIFLIVLPGVAFNLL